jgi:hypothetical protein
VTMTTTYTLLVCGNDNKYRQMRRVYMSFTHLYTRVKGKQ